MADHVKRDNENLMIFSSLNSTKYLHLGFNFENARTLDHITAETTHSIENIQPRWNKRTNQIHTKKFQHTFLIKIPGHDFGHGDEKY